MSGEAGEPFKCGSQLRCSKEGSRPIGLVPLGSLLTSQSLMSTSLTPGRPQDRGYLQNTAKGSLVLMGWGCVVAARHMHGRPCRDNVLGRTLLLKLLPFIPRAEPTGRSYDCISLSVQSFWKTFCPAPAQPSPILLLEPLRGLCAVRAPVGSVTVRHQLSLLLPHSVHWLPTSKGVFDAVSFIFCGQASEE